MWFLDVGARHVTLLTMIYHELWVKAELIRCIAEVGTVEAGWKMRRLLIGEKVARETLLLVGWEEYNSSLLFAPVLGRYQSQWMLFLPATGLSKRFGICAGKIPQPSDKPRI